MKTYLFRTTSRDYKIYALTYTEAYREFRALTENQALSVQFIQQ